MTPSHRQLLEDCLSGEKPDRVPVALWRHFPVDDQTPENLAKAILAFQRQYDFDLIKVTPASSFCLKDWGSDDEWRGGTEGTRTYVKRVIHNPEDWEQLSVLDPGVGHLEAQVRCLELLYAELGDDTPMIQTIFNPLAQAKNLAGPDQLLVHMRQFPDALHIGLQTIAASTQRFIERLLKTGIAGIFYAVQHARYSLLSPQEYKTFGRRYDLQVLEPISDLWLNMLHLHGEHVMFESFLEYPLQIINWHDRETWPSLERAQSLFKGVVCGGLQRNETMMLGTQDQVQEEAHQAIRSTGGFNFILGTGCVVPINVPHGNLLAARRSVETFG